MKISSARARQAILVNDGIPLDPSYPPDHIALFDQNGNRIFFSGTIGIPPGGTAGQVLAKLSDDDYDVGWVDAAVVDPGDGGGDPEPPAGPVYTMPGSPDGATDFEVPGVRISEFPYFFDTTGAPLGANRDAPTVGIWFRVTEPGQVVFDAFSLAGIDGYGYLYSAPDLTSNSTAATLINANDDGAGNSQPRISANLEVGDYILLYSGYDETQWGAASWGIHSDTTAVLSDDLTGPAPIPVVTYPSIPPGPDFSFSVPDIGVLNAYGFDGQPFYSPSAGWEPGRWFDIASDGTVQIQRSGSCTIGVYYANDRSWVSNTGTAPMGVSVTAGQRIAVFVSGADAQITITATGGAAFDETLFTDRGSWDADTEYVTNDKTADAGHEYVLIALEPTTGAPSPFDETDPEYLATAPGDAGAQMAEAHILVAATDQLGAVQDEVMFGGQMYFFDLATGGTVSYFDPKKPTESMILYDSTGEMVDATYPDAAFGAVGVASELAPGRYYLFDQDAFNAGTGHHPTILLSDGATMVPYRKWAQLPAV